MALQGHQNVDYEKAAELAIRKCQLYEEQIRSLKNHLTEVISERDAEKAELAAVRSKVGEAVEELGQIGSLDQTATVFYQIVGRLRQITANLEAAMKKEGA